MIIDDSRLVESVASENHGVIAEAARAEEVAALCADRTAVALLISADAAEDGSIHAGARYGVTNPCSLDAVGETSSALLKRELLLIPRKLGQKTAGQDAAVVNGRERIRKIARRNDADQVVDRSEEIVGLRIFHLEDRSDDVVLRRDSACQFSFVA